MINRCLTPLSFVCFDGGVTENNPTPPLLFGPLSHCTFEIRTNHQEETQLQQLLMSADQELGKEG